MNGVSFINKRLIIYTILLSCGASASPFYASSASISSESELSTSAAKIDNWHCEYCPNAQELTGYVSLNFSLLSDDAYTFSTNTGIEKDKPVFVSAQLMYQNDQGQYGQFYLDKLGLDSLALTGKAGLYGSYQFTVDYQQIPQRKYHQLLTPFTFNDNHLQLPDYWQNLDTISTNQGLDTSNWQQLDNAIDWQKLALNWRYFSDDNFDYALNYQQLKKSGLQQFSAAQLINASYLPLPINQQTELLDGNISYHQDKLYLNLGYFISHFSNSNDSFFYDNPFSSYVAGSKTGQFSAEPENQAYKIKLNLNYRPRMTTSLKLYAALGKMEQNNALLPYSNNAFLAHDLPVDDFNAQVATKDLSLRLYNKWSPTFKINAKYQYKQRDNKSNRYNFTPVVTDTFIGDSIENIPYDFTKEKWQLDANWRFYRKQKASISLKKANTTRFALAHFKNTEQGIVGKLQLQDQANRHYNIKASHFKRDGEKQSENHYLAVSQNPLLYRYNTADRIENKANIHISSNLSNQLAGNINGYFSKRRYHQSTLGLQDDNRYHYGIDINWQFKPHANFTLFFQQEKINATSKIGSRFSYWTSKHHDDIVNLGMTLKVSQLIDDKASLSIEALNSDGNSQSKITTTSSEKLPDIKNIWRRLKVNFSYQISPQLSGELLYQHEKLASDDFAIDKLELKTGDNLLTFGALTPNYNLNYTSMKFTYTF
ncbi:MtrB/PioB family decaheme-associated outer membrane protein [Thalassotalea sp. G2M2-11]|uniref:MtrB/PioB family decaheme-associated outer membrane protein n=1 Tax=Thalassotalea sp. G2M2-11 TaxID=2787627 RepID=UPI0019D1278C|nr:MtrB/PioB family decaheme-associated outer membrane protein [Thalassotalea sp. G2M2-11]